jgi:hypothetical protein
MKVILTFILFLYAVIAFSQKDTSTITYSIKTNNKELDIPELHLTDSLIFRNSFPLNDFINKNITPDTSKVYCIIVRDGYPTYQYPKLILVLGNSQLNLNRISSQKINHKWIKKIEVIKNEKYESLFGNKDGVILIYAKVKYRKQIIEALKTK